MKNAAFAISAIPTTAATFGERLASLTNGMSYPPKNRVAMITLRHIDVFSKKIETQFHGRVFLVISKIQFVLGFRQVKRSAVTFCKSTYQENQEAQWLINDVPNAALNLLNQQWSAYSAFGIRRQSAKFPLAIHKRSPVRRRVMQQAMRICCWRPSHRS